MGFNKLETRRKRINSKCLTNLPAISMRATGEYSAN